MKKIILVCSILTLFATSCRNENNTESQKEDAISTAKLVNDPFDYTVFNNRSSLYTTMDEIEIIYQNPNLSKDEKFSEAIDELNTDYDASLNRNSFDQYLIDNSSSLTLEDLSNQENISETDYELLNNFFTYLQTDSFDDALDKLKEDIIDKKFSSEEFKKYNSFVNCLMIANDYYERKGIDIFHGSELAKKPSPGCALAIAGNAISTLSLNSCFAPGPWCAVAIIGKGISLASLYYSCP